MSILVSNKEFRNCSSTALYGEDGSVRRVMCEESVYITEECPVDDSLYVAVDFNVSKSKDDLGLVSGWANVSVDADGSIPLDWQDDVIAPETLEKAAIKFMLDYRGSGEMHEGSEVGTVVESIVLTKEKQAILGIPEGTVHQGWFVTIKVHDREVFEKVKNGTYRMFSIQGKGRRVKI